MNAPLIMTFSVDVILMAMFPLVNMYMFIAYVGIHVKLQRVIRPTRKDDLCVSRHIQSDIGRISFLGTLQSARGFMHIQ